MPRNTDTDKRYSVCIGINTYAPETKLGPLNYAENDARDMDEMLGKRGFLPENRVLLLGKAATLDEVNAALGTMIFDRSKENDLVVVYFAGHSTPVTVEDNPQIRRSEVFLATYDFNRQLIQDSPFFRSQRSLGMERLRRTFFEGPGSRKRLFIFDSCYSGDFYGPGYRDDIDQVPSYVQDMLNTGTDGRIFMASCLPYQKAVESSVYGHGHFTYYLLQAFGGEKEALRPNGTLTAGSLFDYLDDKLQNQRPVKGGVEFGSFELARFPVSPISGMESALDESGPEKEARLRARFIDQNDYVQDRLKRFVGRRVELTELQKRIAGKMEGGGYVIIKGDAGQGKSSIIAKLIEDRGINTSAYHFIQPGSGSNYQINLLRNLMARLILKYDLPEYYVVGESYQILCGNFLGVLKAIADKGRQEVIYIDGLDQLEMDSSVVPNLNFLPSRLPPGIVLVVGTRPNKTLDAVTQLTELKPNEPYFLQGLSRVDFDLLLQHHEVPLSAALSDSLYQRLTNNPLYLDLVAQELRASHGLGSEELIARVESNPNNIFTITFSRMEQTPEWDDRIRPILGVLLVAQEPLDPQQIAHIFNKGSARIRTGIEQLGGLLTQVSQGRHTLFHPKLREYLKPDVRDPGNAIQFDAEEVEILHRRVTGWCEQEPIEQLWSTLTDPSPRDDFQEYAQKHYIFHLYEARKYERLFEVLNKGDYERGKLRFDASTRSSAMDLIFGCQAAARRASNLEAGKILLGHLWRYTLLRTNLTTRADAYPIEAFQALLALDRERDALNLAELLTQPASKLAVLILITEYLLKQPARETEGLQLYSRVYEIATSTQDDGTRTKALRDLTTALLHTERLTQAVGIARLITNNDEQAAAFNDISEAYGKQHNWYEAQAIARSITIDEERVRALSHLAAELKLAHDIAEAEILWLDASMIASTITDNAKRSRATYCLSVSFMQAQDWERAKITAQSIDNNDEKIRSLSELALSLTQAGLVSQADSVWEEARIAVAEIDEQDRDKAYRIYAIAQIQAGLYAEAERTASRHLTNNPTEKITVFGILATHLIRNCLWEESKRITNLIVKEYDLTDVDVVKLDNILVHVSIDLAQKAQWDQAQEIAFTIPRKQARCSALMGIVSQLAQAGMSQRAQTAWKEASAMSVAQTDTVQTRVAAILVVVLAEVGQIVQAKQILPALPDKQTREHIMEELAVALARVGQIAEAEEIVHAMTNSIRKDTIQRSIAVAQMNAMQPEQAIATARSISHVERQSQALVDLVTICCQMDRWDLALEIASQIQSDHLRSNAQRHIVVALVRSGQLKAAEALVRSIANEYYKAHAWCDLTTTFAQIGGGRSSTSKYVRYIRNDRIQKEAECNVLIVLGQLGLAASTARAIPIGDIQDEALYNVVVAYTHTQSWEQAGKIAEEIRGEQKRDGAWRAIAKECAKGEQWPQAITAFDKIQDSKQRIEVLHVWGDLLIKEANKRNREQIVQHISNSKEKASLLVNIADALAEADHYLEQIRFTQQAWLQANTKDDCEYLFAMVRDLLLRNPEMCADLYESFEWVDMFLKE